MGNHRFEMLDRLQIAYQNLDDALGAPDIRVRLSASRDVFAVAVPQASQLELSSGHGVDPEAQRIMAEALKLMVKTVTEIKTHNAEHGVPDFTQHLQDGDNLPGPKQVIGLDTVGASADDAS